MEGTFNNKLDLIKDKKLTHADDNNSKEIEFQSLWLDLAADSLVYVMFFRNWG
jgi:hypothetical protein